MHGEEGFAEVGGRLEVGEDVGEEMGGVRVGGVFVVVVMGWGAIGRVFAGFVVLEDDDFINAEDG
jgi:hypothetical protein